MLTVECARCGKEFGAQRKTAQYCSVKCRTAATRARARDPKASAVVLPRREGANLIALPQTSGQAESLAATTREDLAAAGRLRTPAGLLAVKLAEILDSGVQDTGSSIAALGKQYLATVDKAMDGVSQAKSPLDEIREALKLA